MATNTITNPDQKRGLDTATEDLTKPRKLDSVPEDPRIVRIYALTEDAQPYTWNLPIGVFNEREQELLLELSDSFGKHGGKRLDKQYSFVEHSDDSETGKMLYTLGIRLGLVGYDQRTGQEVLKSQEDLKGASVRAKGRPIHSVIVGCCYC